MDNAQWLSVTEESLFMHDGLVRVSNLIELPHNITSNLGVSNVDAETGIAAYDTKTEPELSEKLLSVCATQNYSYTWFLEYRLNALCGLWTAQQNLAPPIQYVFGKDGPITEDVIAALKKQGLWKEPDQAAFTQRVGFLMLLPLLQSLNKIDPSVCSTTTQLLFSSLQECPPSGLAKEPPECLDGLENLLCSWLEQVNTDRSLVLDKIQLQTTAASLVALASARYTLMILILFFIHDFTN